MPVKGTIAPDHIPMNKYEVTFIGVLVPNLTITKMSGLESELPAINLPDGTAASGGKTGPGTFDIEIPAHHKLEVAAMELWRQENKEPLTSTAKKIGTLALVSGTGGIRLTRGIVGAWPSKLKLPDMDMNDDGAMAVVTYTISYDDFTPLPI